MNLTEEEKEKRRAYYRANKQMFIDKAKKWKLENPEKTRLSAKKSQEKARAKECKVTKKNVHLQLKYGITLEQYSEMYQDQQGACKICRTPLEFQNLTGKGNKTANVDHNHVTGKVRGLLCNNCNRGIGHLQDSSALLRIAAEYLDATNE